MRSRTRHDALHERLQVFGTDAAAFAAATHLGDVDAQLARHPPDRRRRRRRRACRRRRLVTRWGRRWSLASAAVDVHDFAALLPRSLLGLLNVCAGLDVGCLRLGLRGLAFAAVALGARGAAGFCLRIGRSLLAHAAFFGSCGRLLLRCVRRCLRARFGAFGRRRCTGGVVHREDQLPDLDLVALLDLDLADGAGDVRRDFDRRLVGLELEHRLVFRQGVTGLDQDPDHVAGGHVLAQFRNLEFSCHSSLSDRFRRPSAQHDDSMTRRHDVFW